MNQMGPRLTSKISDEVAQKLIPFKRTFICKLNVAFNVMFLLYLFICVDRVGICHAT